MKINKMMPVQAQPMEQAEMREKLKDVSKLYEQQFLRQMVKAMRKTVSSSGLTKPSMAEKIYRQKLDQQYVESWSQQGGVGLADVIYQQLQEKFGAKGRSQLPRPRMPIPVEKASGMKPITNGQFNILMKSKVTTGVQSPWDARVQQVSHSSDHSKSVVLAHDQAGEMPLKSVLHFHGDLEALKIGQTVEAGQRLGGTTLARPSVSWNVQRLDGPGSLGANV